MPRWTTIAAVGIACASAMTGSRAQAAPIELVSAQDGFLLFNDVDGTVERNEFFTRDPFLEIYGDIEAGFLAAHPDDSQFIVVYTTWELPGSVGALYQALANDVEGIGYVHAAAFDPIIPDEIFDDTPQSQVQGFLHMNRWTQYLGGDGDGVDDTTISHIFGQELGHAWLAFVHVEHPTLPAEALLGRSSAHWSFYAHSAGSPAEGHDWTDNGDGTFTAVSRNLFEFSDLDLYLMGLLPPEQVKPWFVITDVSNCVDSNLPDGSCAPPQAHLFAADTYTVSGTRHDVTVEQVIAAEGPRVPIVGDAPTSYDVSFLLIKRPDEELTTEELALVSAIVQRSVEIFNDQTRGLAEVVNKTASAGPGGGGNTTGDSATSSGSSSDGGTTGAGSGGAPTVTAGQFTASDTDGGGNVDPVPQDGDDGCSCSSGEAPGAPPTFAFALAGLVGLAGLRRRR